MEVMPFVDRGHIAQVVVGANPDASSDWTAGLPLLRGAGVTLRELRREDAASLHAHLTTEQVTRFISPPPTTVAGFERFIAWAHQERAAGRYACFAVVPDGHVEAVGLFQVRFLTTTARVAEWGFILGEKFWGTGVFMAAAVPVVEFAFATMGVTRLEARAAMANGRGNGALAKLGAVREAVLRQSFLCRSQRIDQGLWAIAREDWARRDAARQSIRH